MDKARTIAASMAAAACSPMVQLAQTRFRLRLVEAWGIAAGASVLEIGCGQGDMTAVLADAVGERGRVTAVDIAGPAYGSPVTLGESAAVLAASPLGGRVEVRLSYDVLDPANDFPDDAFDYVVLAHCGWYFASLDQLRLILAKVRPWAVQLCVSEWDLRPRTAGQVPHLLAALIQGQIEAGVVRGTGNIRTPFSCESLTRALHATGWRTTTSRQVDTEGLDDADWEIRTALRMGQAELGSAAAGAVRDLIASQLDVLRALASDRGNEPLPSYVVTAERG